MCERFQVDPEVGAIKEIADAFSLSGQIDVLGKTGEIFPTDTILVLSHEGESFPPTPMSWGFPRWGGKGVMLTARSETALQNPIFRDHLLSRPIAIPTTGFYEWQTVAGVASKNKYLFREPGENILFLAGFAGKFDVKDGRVPDRFVLLSTTANPTVAPYHERMPIPLHKEEVHAWLSGRDLGLFLERTPFTLEARGPL